MSAAAAISRVPVTAAPLLSVKGITKRYGAVVANDNVSFDLAPGEVLGVLGENGAGKSTLVKILGGLVRADAGEIRLSGQPATIDSPRVAAVHGIGMVHQHFMLVEALTVEENLALGDARWGRAAVDYAELRTHVGALAYELAMPVDFGARIRDLPVGAQQRVEILKALARNPRLLILDEPTAILATDERVALFAMIAKLRDREVATIIISHKLEDIFAICDRVAVMRHGRVVAVVRVAEQSPGSLVRLVVGDDVPASRRAPAVGTRVVLDVSGLRLRNADRALALDDVRFSLHAGEVLGVAGVDGNGQSELVRVITGMTRPDAGRLLYRFGADDYLGPLEAGILRRLGMAHIAEDRLRHAAVGGLDLVANWLLTHLHVPTFNRGGWVATAPVADRVQTAIKDFSVKAPGPGAHFGELSGGNQQKLVVARELASSPDMIVAAYPTRGLDLRTIAFVKSQLLAARDRGAAVLVISNDVAEVLELADRVMVMSSGRIHGPVATQSATLEQLGAWMTAR
jgi:simple sugar transport system ATP-binding protein